METKQLFKVQRQMLCVRPEVDRSGCLERGTLGESLVSQCPTAVQGGALTLFFWNTSSKYCLSSLVSSMKKAAAFSCTIMHHVRNLLQVSRKVTSRHRIY